MLTTDDTRVLTELSIEELSERSSALHHISEEAWRLLEERKVQLSDEVRAILASRDSAREKVRQLEVACQKVVEAEAARIARSVEEMREAAQIAEAMGVVYERLYGAPLPFVSREGAPC